MKKHTLGPWSIDKEEQGLGAGLVAIVDDLSTSIAHVETWEGEDKATQEQAQANARLIAAAPELLEALKVLRNAYRLKRPQIFGTDAVEELAIQAIKKAEGR